MVREVHASCKAKKRVLLHFVIRFVLRTYPSLGVSGIGYLTDLAQSLGIEVIIWEDSKLHRDRESEGLPELQRDAKDGGAVAGRARQDIEKQLGTPVVSSQNFLQEPKKKRGKKQHLVPEGQKSLFLDQGSQDSNS